MNRPGSAARNTEWLALLSLAALFALMLFATWQRWTHPIIDHGREMNVPLRLLQGERLYIDIIYYYGPFAPYFNAALYYLFGVHLNTLHAAGAVCALLNLAMIYWLARRLMSPWEGAMTTAFVVITCALSAHLGNFIQPYAYSALYGWTFALASLVCLVRYVTSHNSVWMFWAGVAVGATMTCKPEHGLIGLGPVAVAWVLTSLSARRWLWRPLWLAALPVAAIGAFTYVPLVLLVPWQMLFTDTYRAFSTPQMVFFAEGMSGVRGWPITGWAIVSGAGMALAACGLAALLGLMLDQRLQSLSRRAALRSWLCLIVGAMLWWSGAREAQNFDITPVRSAAVVLAVTIGFVAWRLWQHRAAPDLVSERHKIAFLVAIFSFIAIGRVILNVSLWSPYTAFTVPTVFVVYGYLFFRGAPDLLLPGEGARQYARSVAMALLGIWITSLGIDHVESARLNRFEINLPRARFFIDAMTGPPLAQAIQFAAERTQPGDYVLNVPQGSVINFLADRRHPLREEIIVPGFLTPDREADAIERVKQKNVKLILIANHLTPEYRDRAFGVNYNQALMRWIDAHYHPVATFSAAESAKLEFGDFDFFIRAYERNSE